jgi:molybdopterin-biosynthesis enzyme MoeA-like protein
LLTVRAFLRGPAPFVSRALFLRTEEVSLKPILDGVVERHPGVEIGSYPKWFDPTYKTLITFDARDEALASAALEDLRALVAPSDVVRTG